MQKLMGGELRAGARRSVDVREVWRIGIAMLGAVATSAGCGVETASVARAATPQQAFADTFDKACADAARQPAHPSGTCVVLSLRRRVLAPVDRVAEYTAIVQVGPDPAHDLIGLHRVVREVAPWIPIVSPDALMMVHGDIWPFEGAFLDAPAMGVAPVFLAQNNIDVWGIDLRWTQVAADTVDFAFMKDWGFAQDGRDLGMALAIARGNRFYTGSSAGKLLLLGWSRGAQLGYTYLAAETAQPASQRHVGGFIPADVYVKVPPQDPNRANACARIHDPVQGNQAAFDAGVYVSGGGGLAIAAGALAVTDPAGTNPFFPPGHPFAGFTNEQAALGLGEATYQILFLPPRPHYHFTGGRFDARGAPAGLSYVASAQRWFAAMQKAAPFEPLRVLLDADAIICDDGSSELDAGLRQISVPILYLGAAGGFGATGLYTVELLASSDKTSVVNSATSPDVLPDYGHFDMWLGQPAQRLWWAPMLRWIREHRPAG